jgi:hypothetical protein
MNTCQHLKQETIHNITRRHFLSRCTSGLGALWMAQQGWESHAEMLKRDPKRPASPYPGHLPGRAKHVIYMHMTGSPSQLDLFDYKPLLVKLDGQDCPAEFLRGKRFAFIQGVPQLLGPQYPFHQEKKTGQWISDRLPYLEQQMDKVCVIKSMQSDQFNHAPAQLLVHTGNQNLGHASIGSWVLYGLGSENENLPGYVVLLSGGQIPDAGKAAWASGYLPSVYQGVQCRGEGDPVLYLSNPDGINTELRRQMVDTLKKVNQRTYEAVGDTETVTRIAQYEMAFRMQLSASEAMDITREPEYVHKLYGTQPGKESFANNCLLARRLVERGVRYIQLYDWGWDHHSGLDKGFPDKCKQVDQPMAALLQDLESRGLLDETLVVWSGEFGRTPMQENRGGVKASSPGRDHHIDAFSLWMAGAGIKGGISYGETDDIGFGVVVNPVHVRDLHATMLNRLGIHDQKLTYPFLGLDARLTGVAHPSYVLKDIVS